MIYLPVLLSLALLRKGHAFTGNPTRYSGVSTSQSVHVFGKARQLGRSAAPLMVSSSDGFIRNSDSVITPRGFGFYTPAIRVVKEAARMRGFHRANANDGVIEVTDAITGSLTDVALVFDEESNEFLGIFTEKDYIKFATARAEASTTEEESASFSAAPVKNYLTPAQDVIAIGPDETANVAVSLMNQSNFRHLVVADNISSDRRLLGDSTVLGVISMQDIMNIVQKDERLSFSALAKKYPKIRDPFKQILEPESASEEASEKTKQDIMTVGSSVLFLASLGAFLSQSGWLHDHADLAMIAIFVLGYVGIIFEEVFELNKAGVALLMSTGLWVTYADFFQSSGTASEEALHQLGEQLAEVSDICFFLLAASTIVEVVDLHEGFQVVTNQIKTTSKKQLFWTIGFLTFFLSSILNNLTVTIVMVSLLRKLVPNDDDRRLFGAMVVVAANAGGVWTPIGDVTTTMLWINNQLSTIPTITELFLPSMACLVGSLAFLVPQVEEDDSLAAEPIPEPSELTAQGQLVFWSGIASLLAVPVFAELTGLPPYLAMLTGLGVIWTMTDVMHLADEEEGLKIPAALAKLDTSGILFFLGILMSIGALDKSGLLKELATFLSNTLPSLDIIATVIGIASALIDNVPLVAATMGMYDLADYGTDDRLWQLIALCAGTGGSILVIGSASGVALMGLEKVDFLWYARKVSLGATVGYFAGIAAYLVQNEVLSGNALGAILPQAAMVMDVAQQSIQSFI